ncbi:serine/threonine protein kinase [Cohnella faecalis]|uniref:Serine/threonine protein kinase n=1 Tax=Cohnella faecalis TaxID=2315694 RepID=A0A398CEM6_9BACL|nr:serine/threonine protein kinase [Cohnella faecalis]RIE01163.1 serine/threonine protein kinase [Cohnella faecalis]
MEKDSVINDPISIRLGDVTFQLQEHHDFRWLNHLGNAFCVFDQQDSGNISFGMEINGRKRFINYAGASPLAYTGSPDDAVARLLRAIPLYQQLEHPALIKLVDHFAVDKGHAAVFEWFEGECLHSHWSFPPPAKYNHPGSPFYRFKQLPIEKRLDSMDTILSFHEHVEARGYVAVDFYDGSILYDFKNDITRICDIDFYRQAPSINDLGEDFWGAMRSKSPEEFILGAPIDSRTNVFNMGAIAFGLLGGEMDRSYSGWDAGPLLYEVALRAVSDRRELRYAAVAEFKRAWDTARNSQHL